MGDTKAALAVATWSVTNHYTVHQDATEIAKNCAKKSDKVPLQCVEN